MPDDLNSPAHGDHSPMLQETANQPNTANETTDTSSPGGRADPVGSDFLLREGPQARAGGAATLSERLRRRAAYHADDTTPRPRRPRDRAVTTSHKIAEAMQEFVGPDGRVYAAIPMDLYAEVAKEEMGQEVPEEEYDADAAFLAWSQLDETAKMQRVALAQTALDTLPGNDRAIMERIVLVAANGRAGLKVAAQRTRQYFTVGDHVIEQRRHSFLIAGSSSDRARHDTVHQESWGCPTHALVLIEGGRADRKGPDGRPSAKQTV